MGKIGLIGATGGMGRAIAEVLHEQNRPYVAIGRSIATLEARFGSDPLAECRTWSDQASLEKALAGVESAVYLIGVDYWKFEEHPKLMRLAIDAAKAAGVKRMLLIGSVYPYGRPRSARVDETHSREPHTFKGRMRKEQEDLLLAAHVPGQFETVELRVPDLYGPGMEKSFMTDAFKNAPKGKPSTLLGPIDMPHEYGFIPDCARTAVRVLDEPRAYGTFWNYGGPGTITTREFADEIYAQCGTKPRYFVINKFMLRLIGLFVPMMREIVEMSYLITDPVVLDDSRLRALLGDLTKTSYREGIRLSLRA